MCRDSRPHKGNPCALSGYVLWATGIPLMWTSGPVESLRGHCLAAWWDQRSLALLLRSSATPDAVTGSGMSWATSLPPSLQVYCLLSAATLGTMRKSQSSSLHCDQHIAPSPHLSASALMFYQTT
jgi:hypothetical protein